MSQYDAKVALAQARLKRPVAARSSYPLRPPEMNPSTSGQSMPVSGEKRMTKTQIVHASGMTPGSAHASEIPLSTHARTARSDIPARRSSHLVIRPEQKAAGTKTAPIRTPSHRFCARENACISSAMKKTPFVAAPVPSEPRNVITSPSHKGAGVRWAGWWVSGVVKGFVRVACGSYDRHLQRRWRVVRVAQLDRALASEARGWRFEPSHACLRGGPNRSWGWFTSV